MTVETSVWEERFLEKVEEDDMGGTDEIEQRDGGVRSRVLSLGQEQQINSGV